MTPTGPRPSDGAGSLDLVHDVPLQIRAVLGATRLSVREVVSLHADSVIELDKFASDPVDLYVNDVLVARGEVVVAAGKYAIRIVELATALQ
jgi:flagellar motor switch protein FliN/FliY